MRLLITGGRGRLGRALSVALAGSEISAPGHDELDITNEAAVRETLETTAADVVIHAAAWTDTADCERDPERAMLVNARGAGIVAEACARSGARMVYVSSNEVFDGETDNPYAEDAPVRPINAYGRSKLEGERAVAAASPGHAVVRTSWLYGSGRVSFPEKILQAARSQGSLRGVTDEIASPTWTVDLAQAIARLIQGEPAGVYHLTNAGYCSRLEWARRILSIHGQTDVLVSAATQSDFGAPYRKPVFSALANTRAAAQGVTMRCWEDALADHLAGSASSAFAADNR
jgi:dTDP-4-dehydrorhamnose reductase